MNPNYDIDNRTEKLAARLVYEAVNGKFSKL
jgi:formiminoglutamase